MSQPITAPVDPAAELQRQDRHRQALQQRLEPPHWAAAGPVNRTPVHQRLPDEAPCMPIEKVVLQGVLASTALQQALNGVAGDDSPAGRCLGGQGVTLLVQRLQQALVERGHITSRAEVPEQDLRSGTLTIRLHAGRLAGMRGLMPGDRLPRNALPLRDGDVLDLYAIEQTSDHLQRLPGLAAKLQIEPGEAPGTSDLVVQWAAPQRWRAGLSMDDSGGQATGRLQGQFTLGWDNPLGLADGLSIAGGQDLARDGATGVDKGSHNTMVHYSVPWGWWLLGATWSGSRWRQTVVGPYTSYLYSGGSSQTELSAQRVLHRDGSRKTTASLKVFARQSSNHIDDLEVLVQRRRTAGWEGQLQHLWRRAAGTLTGHLAWRQGTAAFGAQAAPEELLGQGTARMRTFSGLLEWAVPFTAAGRPWQASSQWQWQWQWTRSRLTPQDQFCVGGRSTVRGFDGQHTLCGDRGQLWRNELATPLLSAPGLGATVYANLDAGRVNTPGWPQAQRLVGAAIGLRGQWAPTDNLVWQWDAFVGRPLSHPAGFSAAGHAAGFNLRADF